MPLQLVSLSGHPNLVIESLSLVGRDASCDLRIGSSRISRHHCCLAPEGNEITVRDLGSTNGTRINGCSVIRGRLRDGDELTLAHASYRLVVRELVRIEQASRDQEGDTESSPSGDTAQDVEAIERLRESFRDDS